jgi:hypothetical protein
MGFVRAFSTSLAGTVVPGSPVGAAAAENHLPQQPPGLGPGSFSRIRKRFNYLRLGGLLGDAKSGVEVHTLLHD